MHPTIVHNRSPYKASEIGTSTLCNKNLIIQFQPKKKLCSSVTYVGVLPLSRICQCCLLQCWRWVKTMSLLCDRLPIQPAHHSLGRQTRWWCCRLQRRSWVTNSSLGGEPTPQHACRGWALISCLSPHCTDSAST